MYGVYNGQDLLTFDTSNPSALTSNKAITGLGPGDAIAAIAFSADTAQLYGVTSAWVYDIDPATGSASRIAPVPVGQIWFGQIGATFDPGTAALRIIWDANARSDTFRNITVNVMSGVLTQYSWLGFDRNDPHWGQYVSVDNITWGQAAGAAPALYGIDSAWGLVKINPVTGGVSTVGPVPALTGGNLQVAFTFSALTGTAWAAARDSNGSENLYSVNLLTGSTTGAGTVGNLKSGALLLSAADAQTAAEPGTWILMSGGALAFSLVTLKRQRTDFTRRQAAK